MSDLPAWVYQLLDSLREFDEGHPKLFAQFYPDYDYKPADCPCHLLALVPEQVKRDRVDVHAGRAVGRRESRGSRRGPDADGHSHHAG